MTGPPAAGDRASNDAGPGRPPVLVFRHDTVCMRKARPADPPGAQCPDCGHALYGHIGTPGCPVCRLVSAASQFEAWARTASYQTGRNQ